MAEGLLALLTRGRRAQLTGLGALLVVSSAVPLAGPQLMRVFYADPGGRHDIPTLASLAGLSPRHLQRRFTREIGLPPATYIERVRIEAAQRALAERDDPVESIARHYGFGTAETLRRTFHRLVGIAPSDYRARFRAVHA
jgi:transcriptional regulator GlxA family with amidase domain